MVKISKVSPMSCMSSMTRLDMNKGREEVSRFEGVVYFQNQGETGFPTFRLYGCLLQGVDIFILFPGLILIFNLVIMLHHYIRS